jgi:hypothetical protein
MADRDQWWVIMKTTEKRVKGKKPAIEKGRRLRVTPDTLTHFTMWTSSPLPSSFI